MNVKKIKKGIEKNQKRVRKPRKINQESVQSRNLGIRLNRNRNKKKNRKIKEDRSKNSVRDKNNEENKKNHQANRPIFKNYQNNLNSHKAS